MLEYIGNFVLLVCSLFSSGTTKVKEHVKKEINKKKEENIRNTMSEIRELRLQAERKSYNNRLANEALARRARELSNEQEKIKRFLDRRDYMEDQALKHLAMSYEGKVDDSSQLTYKGVIYNIKELISAYKKQGAINDRYKW